MRGILYLLTDVPRLCPFQAAAAAARSANVKSNALLIGFRPEGLGRPASQTGAPCLAGGRADIPTGRTKGTRSPLDQGGRYCPLERGIACEQVVAAECGKLHCEDREGKESQSANLTRRWRSRRREGGTTTPPFLSLIFSFLDEHCELASLLLESRPARPARGTSHAASHMFDSIRVPVAVPCRV